MQVYRGFRTHGVTPQVRILHDDARVRLANQVNLASALRTALLLLPESFTEVQLFEEIAGLSYRGDFRMKVGENPLKVRNIVSAQLESFRSLYGGLLKSFWKSVHVIGEEHDTEGRSLRLLRQDRSDAQRANTAKKLPIGLKGKVLAHYERKWNLNRALGAGPVEELSKFEQEKDQQLLWERIVADDEFQEILVTSESHQSSLGAESLTSLGSLRPRQHRRSSHFQSVAQRHPQCWAAQESTLRESAFACTVRRLEAHLSFSPSDRT